MSSNLLRVVQEQQEIIEKQSRLIADLIATLESWEQTARTTAQMNTKSRKAKKQLLIWKSSLAIPTGFVP